MHVRYDTLDWPLHTLTCWSQCRSAPSAFSILTPTTSTRPPWLSLALTHCMPTTKFFKRHVLASSSVLIDETTTLLAACEMRNPFTHFEHINKLSKSFITYCLDRYTQLFPVTHSVITALYSNLGYLVRLVYWLNSLVIAVYISFICVLFFMTSFCASLIQHLMLQYSINHWLMLIIGTRSWWNCRDRLVKS